MELDYSKYYNSSAGTHVDGSHREAQRYLQELQPYLPQDKLAHVLEIGTGNGLILERLIKLGYANAAGLEADKKLADTLRYRELPVTHIAAEATVAALSEAGETYDLIFCMHVIEHVPKHAQLGFVGAARQALKPGGYFICETPNALSPTANYWRYQDWTHTSCFTPDSLAFLFQANGFNVMYAGAAREGVPPLRSNPVAYWVLRSAEVLLKGLSRTISRIHYVAEFGLAGFRLPLTRSLLIVGKKI